MQLSRIITNRKIDPHHANDLVYEWEDDLREYFGAPLYYNQAIKNERYSKYIPLLRYPKNADTDFYELPSLGEHLATYEQFCKALDRARREPVDMNRYSRYMQAHYTSAVADQLRQILQRL